MAKRDELEENLSQKAKIGLLGGLGFAAVGGVYLLFRANKASAQTADTGPTGPTGQTCQMLATDLAAYRASANPDPAQIAAKEAQLAACVNAVREAGGQVPADIAQLADGDERRQLIDQKFAEYKRVSYSDALRRNNLRSLILRKGAEMAQKYKGAAESATSAASAQMVRQSVLAALDSSVSRRLCFLYGENGCGRFGLNEDDNKAKAQQERERILAPLVQAHSAAVEKLGGPGKERVNRGSRQYHTIMRRSCERLKGYVDAEFQHYKSTSYSDAVKRNNTRQTILRSGGSLAACIRALYDDAAKYNDMASMEAAGRLMIAAINASVDRWACYLLDQPGCGRFGVNEDGKTKKAADELSRVINPMFAQATHMANDMTRRGYTWLWADMATSRLRMCSVLKTEIDREFQHYKTTSYSDAVKRNNTRQTILRLGRELSQCLSSALSDARKAPPVRLTQVRWLGLRGMGGLGAYSAATGNSVSAVAASALSALDSSMTRKICFSLDMPGCGRFGVNEDGNEKKAADEQARVLAPLLAVAKGASDTLAARGDRKAETEMARILMRETSAIRDRLNAKFAEYKRVSYSDAIRRNNLRQVVLKLGRQLVGRLQAVRLNTPEAKAVARRVAEQALSDSRAREACYRSGRDGCGRFGFNEDDNNKKGDQEAAAVGRPLAALLAGGSLKGLGHYHGAIGYLT
jgi:hypothetical protein